MKSSHYHKKYLNFDFCNEGCFFGLPCDGGFSITTAIQAVIGHSDSLKLLISSTIPPTQKVFRAVLNNSQRRAYQYGVQYLIGPIEYSTCRHILKHVNLLRGTTLTRQVSHVCVSPVEWNFWNFRAKCI